MMLGLRVDLAGFCRSIIWPAPGCRRDSRRTLAAARFGFIPSHDFSLYDHVLAASLSGFVLPEAGWVQSHGSRCVHPPNLFGDVARPEPLISEWTGYAATCTSGR